MTDDELMDRFLRETMAGEAPQLSPAFDASVMARVRGRRLTRSGRAVMVAYAIGALVMVVWTTREAGVAAMAVSTLVCALVALGLSSYARAVMLRSV